MVTFIRTAIRATLWSLGEWGAASLFCLLLVGCAHFGVIGLTPVFHDNAYLAMFVISMVMGLVAAFILPRWGVAEGHAHYRSE